MDKDTMNQILTVVGGSLALAESPQGLAARLKCEGWDCVPDEVPERMSMETARQAMVDLTLAGELDWPEVGTFAYHTLKSTMKDYEGGR